MRTAVLLALGFTLLCSADAHAAQPSRAPATKAPAQAIPRLSKSLRTLASLNPFLAPAAQVHDAGLQTARMVERIEQRRWKPIPEISLDRFRALTRSRATLQASLASGALPQHFRLLYPHRSDPRTDKPVLREVDIHLPSNAAAQLREQGGMWSITNLHGYTSDAIEQAALTNMNSIAGDQGLLTIHPQGLMAYDKQLHRETRSWNTPACCGPAQEHGFRDVEFLGELHATLTKALRLQKKALTGESNGGFMTYFARRKLNDVFQVAFPVAGTEPASKAAPEKTIPTFTYLGKRDLLVNPLTAKLQGAESPLDAARRVMRENGAVESKERTLPGVFKETVHRDADGQVVGAVREISAPGFASHFWPGGEYTTSSILKRTVHVFRDLEAR